MNQDKGTGKEAVHVAMGRTRVCPADACLQKRPAEPRPGPTMSNGEYPKCPTSVVERSTAWDAKYDGRRFHRLILHKPPSSDPLAQINYSLAYTSGRSKVLSS